MKTRKNRRINVETSHRQKDGIAANNISPLTARVFDQSRRLCPSSGKLLTSVQRVDYAESATSWVNDVGTSSDDRHSACSSPLSDSSFSDSSCDDEFSSQVELGHKAFPSRWFNVFHLKWEPSPLFSLDSDVMAQILTFLGPSEILNILTMPLSKEWQRNYGSHQDLWRTLCLVEPFKANIMDDPDDETSNTSFSSLPFEPAVKKIFGEYRLMYTSFVRCLRYLERIQDDARCGRALSTVDYGRSGFPHFGVSTGLQKFLSTRNDILDDSKVEAAHADIHTNSVGVTDDGYRKVR